MARLFSSSHELASATAGMEFHQTNGVVVVEAGVGVRTGAVAHHLKNLVSGTSQRGSFRVVNAPVAGPLWGRTYLYITTLPAAANTIIRMTGAGTTLRVVLTATGNLQLIDEVGTIGTSAGTLNTGQFYRVEVLLDSHLGAGAHVATLRLDGVDVVTASNRTFTNPTVQQWDEGGNMNGETQTVGDWWFDDFGLNDNTATSDSSQMSWPGSGKVAHALLTADGDAAVNVTRGGVDSGANWSQLDEVTPNDATDYLDLTSTTSVFWGRTQNSAALGIGGAYIIKFVAVGARLALASAGAGNWLPSIKSQASGAVLDGSPVALALATYATHDDTSGLQQHKLTAYKDPQTNGAWTATRLDGLQIGVKSTDGSPATRVSALWAVIEYEAFTVTIPTVLKGGLVGGLSVPSGGLL